MFNPLNIPSTSVQDLKQKLENGTDFVLLDVREPVELLKANLGNVALNVPLSKLAEYGTERLPDKVLQDKEAEIVVLCHHGNRSAQVTAWLRQQGWTRVFNLTGGIDAYAAIDLSVGRY